MSTPGNNHIPIDDGSYQTGKEFTPTPSQLQLFYNYPSSTISSSEVVYKNRSSDDKSRIESTFTFNTTTPQFIFGTTTNFTSEKITITSLVHNIFPGITEKNNEKMNGNEPAITGELIIKHKPQSGTGNLYSCFLLEKQETGSINNVDALISMADDDDMQPKDIAIGQDIPTNQKAVSYDSKGNKIVVFLTPIKINGASANIIKNLYYNFEDKFYGTNENIKKDPKISGNAEKTFMIHESEEGAVANANTTALSSTDMPEMPVGSDYYLDCRPTGESAETIAHYNVPIQSEYTENAQKVEAQKTFINFIIFIVMLVIVYSMVPSLYKFLIYDRIISKEGGTANTKAMYLRSIDWTLTILFAALSFLLATAVEKYTIIYIIYSVVFLAMCMMMINGEKNSNALWKNILDYNDAADYKNNFGPSFANFIQTFFAFIIYPFFKTKKEKPNAFGIAGSVLFILAITLCVVFIPGKGETKWIDENALLYIFMIFSAIGFSGIFEFLAFDKD